MKIKISYQQKSYSLFSELPDSQLLFSPDIWDALESSPLFLVIELLKAELLTDGDICLEFPQLDIILNELFEFLVSSQVDSNVLEITVRDCKKSLRNQLEAFIAQSGVEVRLEKLEKYGEESDDEDLECVKPENHDGMVGVDEIPSNQTLFEGAVVENDLVTSERNVKDFALGQNHGYPETLVHQSVTDISMENAPAKDGEADDRLEDAGLAKETGRDNGNTYTTLVENEKIQVTEQVVLKSELKETIAEKLCDECEQACDAGTFLEEDYMVYESSDEDESSTVNSHLPNTNPGTPVANESKKHILSNALSGLDPKRIKV